MNDQIEKLFEHVRVNEQIERLAKESGCTIDRLGFGEGNLEKFAKLMVKKFDDILILEQLDCIGNMDKKSVLLLDKIRERTKTYFGVEE